MRGEHIVEALQNVRVVGSSPHARGTLGSTLLGKPVYGIIPACAGNTPCMLVSWLYFVKLICTVSSLFLDSFVVHSGRFGLSGFLLVLFGYFISEWVFL